MATLNQNQQETKLSQGISNKPPKVYFVTQPTMLVLIDGEPKLQYNKDLKLDMVVNTPFTIVKKNDGRFYLYGGESTGMSPMLLQDLMNIPMARYRRISYNVENQIIQ